MSGSSSSLAAAVQQVLAAGGALSEDELVSALAAAGIDLGPYPGDALEEILDVSGVLVAALADLRCVWLPALLDGRTFTHRLSAAEHEHDMLVFDADLAPVSFLTESPTYQRLTDGSPLVDVSAMLDHDLLVQRGVPGTEVGDDGALLFEPGRWAALGVGPGDLVGLRVHSDGFELVDVTTLSVSGIGASLAALLEEDPDRPEMLGSAIWTLCADDDDRFRLPVAPLGELIVAEGLSTLGDWVAARGVDLNRWHLKGTARLMTARYGLGDDEALAVLATVRLYEQVRQVFAAALRADAADDAEDDVDELVNRFSTSLAPSSGAADPQLETVRGVLELLQEPAVAEAVLAEICERDDDPGAALGLFAETLEPLAPRPARPALRWLRAWAHEQLGEVERAERTYSDAESLDPSWPPVLMALARFAGERGDAERGLALLRRGGAPPDHPLVAVLEHFQPVARPDLGRNQPCWCGSGRKYKTCHRNREQLPLAERAAWLYQKAGALLHEGGFRDLLLEVAQARAEHDDSMDALDRALTDGLSSDVVLFEGGAFAEYLDVRGRLLPDDEHLLAAQWLLVERSVHEVVSVRRGEGMTLRDVRTGDVHEVRERSGSRQVQVGALYCARVVPAGETMQIFGGIEPVSVGLRDTVVALLDDEPDPVELVAVLSSRFAPPRLQNTDGEPLVMCEATLRTQDAAALVETLDAEHDPTGGEPDGTRAWSVQGHNHGVDVVHAHLELSGGELRVQANSEARFERVLATVRASLPALTMVDESREPAGDVRAMRELVEPGPSPESPFLDAAADPVLTAALQEMIATYEASWLDESLPALDGRTPRECADDPTRRPDLLRLLSSFPPDDGRPGAMSPDRLRAALGLS